MIMMQIRLHPFLHELLAHSFLPSNKSTIPQSLVYTISISGVTISAYHFVAVLLCIVSSLFMSMFSLKVVSCQPLHPVISKIVSRMLSICCSRRLQEREIVKKKTYMLYSYVTKEGKIGRRKGGV